MERIGLILMVSHFLFSILTSPLKKCELSRKQLKLNPSSLSKVEYDVSEFSVLICMIYLVIVP
jgi:hypothetical protein